LLATYVSALVIIIGSILVGRALTRALGWRETTWLEPAVGFAVLVLVGSLTVRGFNTATASAIAIGALMLISLAYLRFRVMTVDDLRVAAAPALVAGAVASLPLLASMRVGILGVGINNDLAEHLLWANWLQHQTDPTPVGLANGYPVGPHSLAAALGNVFGFEMTDAIVGLLIAVAVLTSLTALVLLRELPPLRRVLGAALVALPYMSASALAVGGFKETTIALIVLGFVAGLARLEREGADRALLVSLGLITAGAMAVYSYPGLSWLIAAAGLLALVALVRAWRAGDLGHAVRHGAAVALIPIAVFLVAGAGEIPRARTFHDRSGVTTVIEGNSKLRQAVSPLETLGAWPDSDFLSGTGGPPAYLAFGVLGLVALGFATLWWLRRGSLAIPVAVAGAGAVYLYTLATAGLYVQSKALAVPAPVVMLLIARALLDPERPTVRWAAVAKPALAVAFVVVAGYSSFVALRDAVVAPNEHSDELDSIRARVQGEWTLSLTTDRFTDYQLGTTMVGSPARNAQIIIPSRGGKDYRLPLDFDSVDPETLDQFRWVLATRAPYRSQPPPNLRLVEQTRSYELWERVGPTPVDERVFGEEARPGKVLGCTRKDLAIGVKREVATKATIFDPRPVIGKRYAWRPDNELGGGESATLTLKLPPGRWELSMQYQSPVVALTVEAGGHSFDVPAAMDGAIPFRLGQGPFWPVGEVTSSGGPVPITVRADDLSAFQRLIGVSRKGAIGNIAATQANPYRTIPFSQACGKYVDHYKVRRRVLKRKHIERLREIAHAALDGHYQPKTSDQRTAIKANGAAEGQ
jgi:hypothetical protein